MGSKKFADTRSNAFNPSSRCHWPEGPARAPRAHSPDQGDAAEPRGARRDRAQSAFTSVTSRVSEDLASPKSIEVFGA